MTLLQPPPGTVVVGIDGSTSSDKALEWALDQARLGHCPLTLVHAMDLLGPGQTTLSGASLIGRPDVVEALAKVGADVLEGAVRRARHLAPDLEMYDVLSQADPRNALLAASEHATMVVIGSRGRGPVASLLLGSVGVAVSKHADCPVVIVRPQEPDETHEGVLVGIDGTDLDHSVLELAFGIASLRTSPLTVLHCVSDASHLGPRADRAADDAHRLEDTRVRLQDAVRPMAEKFPDVVLDLELVRGFADQRLIERSRAVDVVVVGCRHPRFPSLDFSSIAPTVVEHAHCAVAVVPLTT